MLLVQNVHSQLLLTSSIVVMALAMIVIALRLRGYPLKVQDRVIRLEERLRLAALLPPALQKRIPEITKIN